MKYISLFLLVVSFNAFSQTVTGPGIADDPPTSAMERQEDDVTASPSEAMDGGENKQFQTADDKLNNRGPKGRQAQEAAKTNEMDLSEKEIQKKQKGR